MCWISIVVIFDCSKLVKWSHVALGAIASIIICTFWCFSPDVLAHGQTIVPEVGSVALGVMACFSLNKYIQDPRCSQAFSAGAFLGLALLTKLTWLTGLATFPLTALMCGIWLKKDLQSREHWRRCLDCGLMITTAIIVLNAGYFFEENGTKLRDYEFCSQQLGGAGCNALNLGNRFYAKQAWGFSDPLPKNYVLGIDYLKYEVEEKKWSFLLGEWRFGSWWYYYIFTTLVKTPLATLIGR